MTAQEQPDYIIYKDMGMIFIDKEVLACITSSIPPEKRISDQPLLDEGIYNLILHNNNSQPIFILIPHDLSSTPPILGIYEAYYT